MPNPGRYKKILVPWDGSAWSQRAIPHATDIAQANDSQLIVLYVFRPPGTEYAEQYTLAGQEGQIQQLRSQVRKALDDVEHDLESKDVKARTVLIESPAVANAICDFVRDEDIDLVVMSTHGRTGINRFLFGSVAAKVMEEVKVPVLLVHPERE